MPLVQPIYETTNSTVSNDNEFSRGKRLNASCARGTAYR